MCKLVFKELVCLNTVEWFIEFLLLYSYIIHTCLQKHNDAMKTSEHTSLEKYTSHFI